LMCSPTKPLSNQIYNEFKKETDLDSDKIFLFTGATQPEKRITGYKLQITSQSP